MRQPVAAAERLRHRVAEREEGAAERGARLRGSVEQRGTGREILPVVEHPRKPGGDQTRPGDRVHVGVVVVALDVERLGAVRERVQRRAAALLGRQVERQLRLVDDPGRMGVGAASAQLPGEIADAVERRPLGAGVRRRDRHERPPRLRRHRLSEVDRAPTPEREHDVGAAREPGYALDLVRGRARPGVDRLEREGEIEPAVRGDQVRVVRPELVEHIRKLVEPPADDHASRSRAKATNASVARVEARPAARTSTISRAGSRPSTLAAASLPESSSASTAEREMNVTP